MMRWTMARGLARVGLALGALFFLAGPSVAQQPCATGCAPGAATG
ncbi:MAG: hypothetical protein U0793_26165 [Gemmataceae bacterium]